jgi:ergothioneine biosynthesis protein EgtB
MTLRTHNPLDNSSENNVELLKRYQLIRQQTLEICQPLEIEDMVVQPAVFVSPPKWHLAHTTWFFVNFIFHRFGIEFSWPDENYPQLFNSYYKSQGQHWEQGHRGDLSRPTVKQIIHFRQNVDEVMVAWLSSFNGDIPADIQKLLRLGLEHEQQHQELLLMDIKFILWRNPSKPAYIPPIVGLPICKGLEQSVGNTWSSDGGLKEFGINFNDHEFCFDNETPKHQVFLTPYAMSHRPISNAQFAEFIEDGGYQEPSHWLSEGWDLINVSHIRSPLYWSFVDGVWFEYTLQGLAELVQDSPVSHISFHEAYAYARWAKKRLPTEFEWEHFANHCPRQDDLELLFLEKNLPYAYFPEGQDHFVNVNGGLWEWTSSSYASYPGYEATRDAFGEYNGKFMINQMVLRGGCFATPESHYRSSYRNFYQASQRWAFTGLRLAEGVL